MTEVDAEPPKKKSINLDNINNAKTAQTAKIKGVITRPDGTKGKYESSVTKDEALANFRRYRTLKKNELEEVEEQKVAATQVEPALVEMD